MEINSKQGAPASQVMNILQTACGRGRVADRDGLMRMTLKVAENRKIPSFFICMQIGLLHKLTPDPWCQSSSGAEAGPPPGAPSQQPYTCTLCQVSPTFTLRSKQIWSSAHLRFTPSSDGEATSRGGSDPPRGHMTSNPHAL